MKFCPIVPIAYLNKLAGLSNNQMVLVQWLSDKRYFKFYRKRRDKGDFIILDNGACELGTSLPESELLHWFKALYGVNVVVIPDSKNQNLDYFEAFNPEPFLEFYSGVEFMAAPHSLEDLEVMVNSKVPNYIGLNRDFEDYGRAKVIEQYKNCGKKFHLLGIRKNPIDEVLAVRSFGDLVLGVDSSFPYRLASRGRTVTEYRPYPDHDSMYRKDLSPEILNFCVREFKSFLDWVNSNE